MRTRPVRMARWSARHPWRAIVGWFVFVLLCLGAGIAVGNNSATTKDFWVVLSAAAALGALVLVFQGTWAEGLLDFDSLGAIASRVPLFLFVLLFGLSMDYQVFVVSRIKEAMEHGMTAREAVLDGIARLDRYLGHHTHGDPVLGHHRVRGRDPPPDRASQHRRRPGTPPAVERVR